MNYGGNVILFRHAHYLVLLPVPHPQEAPLNLILMAHPKETLVQCDLVEFVMTRREQSFMSSLDSLEHNKAMRQNSKDFCKA